MSIINEAIKKARKEFVISKNPSQGRVDIEEKIICTPAAQPADAKWLTLAIASLVVIVSLLGSLFLYRHVSRLNNAEHPSFPVPDIDKRNAFPLLNKRDLVVLNGIVCGPEDKWAVINNEISREGDRLPAGRLILIEENFVVIMQENGDELVLELK